MIGIIGSSNVDIVYEVQQFTKPGETQRAFSLNYYFGGKGANQAITCARLSKGDIYFCSLVGTDSSGEDYVKRFEEENISGVQKYGTNTGKAFIEVSKAGDNRIIIYGGANDLLSPSHIDAFLEKHGDFFSIGLLQNEIPKASNEYAIKALKKANKTIIYDPAPKENTLLELLGQVDYLTPNETEFAYLYEKIFGTDEKDVKEKAIRFRSETKVKHLILKHGEKSVIMVNSQNNIEEVVPPKVKAVDSTAAGDVFNSAFAVALSKKMNQKNSLEFAIKAASLSVTRKGAQPSIPRLEEIQ
ncbi:MAG: PfkB family carbohydrate kinase [Thermotogota bacterium]|nr:PfkB family carbohydrate kinase [Thermotogota bacterium]